MDRQHQIDVLREILDGVVVKSMDYDKLGGIVCIEFMGTTVKGVDDFVGLLWETHK